MVSRYARGMVYWVNLPTAYGDSVQTGRRPCIIVSNNVGNLFSDNLTVVPCTTNIEKINSQPTHYNTKIYSNTESVVLCENIITVAKKLCDGFIGIMDEQEINKIDECIKIALGLVDIPQPVKLEEVPEDPEIPEEEKATGRIVNDEVKRQYISDFAKYGADYVMRKYKVASISAANQRKNYYKNQLTKSK